MNRTLVLTLHRWLGLAFAPLLLLQVLTGTVLLLRDEFQARRGLPAQETQATVSTLLTSADRALPGSRVTRLFLPAYAGAPVRVQLVVPSGATRYASLDPATAQVTRAGPIWRFPLEMALQLHYQLLNGRTGMAVVLANGTVLLMLAGSGLGFWWPGRRRILSSLVVRRNLPGRFRLRQWHRSIGATISTIALFSAVTGVLLVAPDLASPAAGQTAAVPPASASQLDRAIAIARSQFPGARLRDIRFPAADRLDINFFAPERNLRAVHVVSVRPSDGAIIKVLPAAGNSVLWMKILPLHTGESFGPLGFFVLLCEAGALLFLACAGPIMWAQVRSKRKAR